MIRRFFGDGERDFALPAKMILELEEKTDTGFGDLWRKISSNSFRLIEITETIRLALIGGGTQPVDADRLVRTYVDLDGTSLVEAVVLASDILTDRYTGAPKEGTADEPA